MNKTSVKERRAHERHWATVHLQGTPEDGGVVVRMIVRNLSMGGLYCTSSKDFAEMTRLAVRLMLPLKNGEGTETEPVDVEAIVVRLEKLPAATGKPRFELALFFPKLEGTPREQLRRFLDHQAEAT